MGKTLNEAAGRFYIGNNLLDSKYDLDYQIQKKKREEDEVKLAELLLEAEKAKQKEIEEKIERLELLPYGAKIIIEKYPTNPYRKIMEGGIIVDYTGEFQNPDSGEKDKLKELVGCAKVIEVGPECKYTRPGDDIYYDTRTTYPFPYMSMGYEILTEPQILCVINEGLKERFKS